MKSFTAGILFIVLLYQDALTYNINSVFGYVDELEAVVAVSILIVHYMKKAFMVPINRKKIILPYMGIIVCGLSGNLQSGFQTVGYIALDMLTCSKMFINFILLMAVKKRADKTMEYIMYKISAISICIMFMLVIHEYIFPPFFPYLVDRYHVHSLKLFFSNQTYLAETGIYLLLIITIIGGKEHGNSLLKAMAIIVVISTMRTKALGFIAVYIMLHMIPVIRNKRKLLFFLFLAGMLCIIVGHEYISYYFFGESSRVSPRKILLMDSLGIAKEYFPFGSGFGTFCSGAANLSYSRIYAEHGYLPDQYPFNDMFWACIIGQFGFLGCVFFIIYVYEMILCIINCKGSLKQSYYGTMLYIIYLMIATFGECSFFAPYSNLFGMTVGYFIATRRHEEIYRRLDKIYICEGGKFPYA